MVYFEPKYLINLNVEHNEKASNFNLLGISVKTATIMNQQACLILTICLTCISIYLIYKYGGLDKIVTYQQKHHPVVQQIHQPVIQQMHQATVEQTNQPAVEQTHQSAVGRKRQQQAVNGENNTTVSTRSRNWLIYYDKRVINERRLV